MLFDPCSVTRQSLQGWGCVSGAGAITPWVVQRLQLRPCGVPVWVADTWEVSGKHVFGTITESSCPVKQSAPEPPSSAAQPSQHVSPISYVPIQRAKWREVQGKGHLFTELGPGCRLSLPVIFGYLIRRTQISTCWCCDVETLRLMSLHTVRTLGHFKMKTVKGYSTQINKILASCGNKQWE